MLYWKKENYHEILSKIKEGIVSKRNLEEIETL